MSSLQRSAVLFHDDPSSLLPVPVERFRDHCLMLYSPPLRARATWINVRRSLDLFLSLPGLVTTADFTTSAVARFVTSRSGKENPNTTRGHLRKLSGCFSIAVGEGWLRINPFAIRKGWVRGVTPAQPRVHTRQEIARILALASSDVHLADPRQRWKARRLHALFATAAYTGMRRTEVLTLQVGDVDLRERMIFLKHRVGGVLKTEASAQPVPVPDALAVVLRGWIGWVDQAGHLFPSASNREVHWSGGPAGRKPLDALKSLGERAGVPDVTFQSLRHSWATHAEFWGLSDAMIQRVMRHTSIKTQQRYRHADAANIREKVRGIDFGGAERKSDPLDRLAERTRAARESAAGGVPDTTGADLAGDGPPRPPGRGSYRSFYNVAAAGESPAPPRAVEIGPGSSYLAGVEFREVPGLPHYALGSDRTLWTDSPRDGHRRPGVTYPWRPVAGSLKPGGTCKVFNFQVAGRKRQRTLESLMREVFGSDL